MTNGTQKIDPAMVAYILLLPKLLTWSGIEAACVERFGRAKTPSADEIMLYMLRHHPPKRMTLFDRDPEMKAFAEGLVGRVVPYQIYQELRAKFGDRAPSMPSVYSFVRRTKKAVALAEPKRPHRRAA